MSSRTLGNASDSAGGRPQPEGIHPQIRQPKQGSTGHLLAFLSVMAVLGFGLWTAMGTLIGSAEKGSAKPAPTVAATAGPTAAPASVPATIPAPAPTAASVPTPSPAAPAAAPGGARVHVVAAGDTLFGIAQKYKTTVDAIMAANGITDRSKILHVGDKITIP